MKKKIMLFLVAIIGFIGFVNVVSAKELICDYKKTNPIRTGRSEFYNIHFNIDNYGYKTTEIWYTTVSNTNDEDYNKEDVTTKYTVTPDGTTVDMIGKGTCPQRMKVTGSQIHLVPMNGEEAFVLSGHSLNISLDLKKWDLSCKYKRYTETDNEFYHTVFVQWHDIPYEGYLFGFEIWDKEDKLLYYTFKKNQKDSNGDYIDLTGDDYGSTYTISSCPTDLEFLEDGDETYVFLTDKQKDYFYLNNTDSSSKYCTEHVEENECKVNDCVWVENKNATNGGYCNLNKLQYVKCGGAYDIPKEVPQVTTFIVYLLQIATPIILIIVGLISLVKAVAASKEDEIKKAQSSLIKKIIAAALVFFVIAIVKFVISMFADSVTIQKNGETEASNVSTCLDCFLSNDCSKNTYYISNIAGTEMCTLLDGTTKTCKDFYNK